MEKTFKEYLNQEKEKYENIDVFTRLEHLYFLREQSIDGTEINNNGTLLYRYNTGSSFIYFHTEYELIEYLKKHKYNFRNIAIIDYIGEFGNKDDVIRVIDHSSIRLLIDKNIHEHFEYSFNRSRYEHLPVWVSIDGNIHELVLELKKLGQKFKQDDIDQENLRLLRLIRLGLIK